VASQIEQSTRIAFARYRSFFECMSRVRHDVTMMTYHAMSV
jgi:hypothetical protein